MLQYQEEEDRADRQAIRRRLGWFKEKWEKRKETSMRAESGRKERNLRKLEWPCQCVRETVFSWPWSCLLCPRNATGALRSRLARMVGTWASARASDLVQADIISTAGWNAWAPTEYQEASFWRTRVCRWCKKTWMERTVVDDGPWRGLKITSLGESWMKETAKSVSFTRRLPAFSLLERSCCWQTDN